MPEKLYHECCELISRSRATLNDLSDWGFDTVVCEEQSSLPVCPLGVQGVSEKKENCRIETLDELGERLQDCILCPLCEQRNKVVFGTGNQQADLMMIGEAPGREEDEAGIPFVGEAGQLLDRILFAMKLSRQDVYICNLIKCRPPQDRAANHDEVAACEPFLKQQIAAVRPRIIVTFGRFAAQTMLRANDPDVPLRGHWHKYEGVSLMATYHPEFLLNNPPAKRDVWQDMKQVVHRLQG